MCKLNNNKTELMLVTLKMTKHVHNLPYFISFQSAIKVVFRIRLNFYGELAHL